MGWVRGFFSADYFIYDEKYKYTENYKFLRRNTFCGLRNNVAYFLSDYHHKRLYFDGQCLLFDLQKKSGFRKSIATKSLKFFFNGHVCSEPLQITLRLHI